MKPKISMLDWLRQEVSRVDAQLAKKHRWSKRVELVTEKSEMLKGIAQLTMVKEEVER